jgi:hypothetical protein
MDHQQEISALLSPVYSQHQQEPIKPHVVEHAASVYSQHHEQQSHHHVSHVGTPAYSQAEQRLPEPLLEENPHRFVIMPIQYNDIWKMYKDQMACFWNVGELDLEQDQRDWEKLSDNDRHFIKHVLAFFAASDGIVLENLAGRFMSEV